MHLWLTLLWCNTLHLCFCLLTNTAAAAAAAPVPTAMTASCWQLTKDAVQDVSRVQGWCDDVQLSVYEEERGQGGRDGAVGPHWGGQSADFIT